MIEAKNAIPIVPPTNFHWGQWTAQTPIVAGKGEMSGCVMNSTLGNPQEDRLIAICFANDGIGMYTYDPVIGFTLKGERYDTEIYDTVKICRLTGDSLAIVKSGKASSSLMKLQWTGEGWIAASEETQINSEFCHQLITAVSNTRVAYFDSASESLRTMELQEDLTWQRYGALTPLDWHWLASIDNLISFDENTIGFSNPRTDDFEIYYFETANQVNNWLKQNWFPLDDYSPAGFNGITMLSPEYMLMVDGNPSPNLYGVWYYKDFELVRAGPLSFPFDILTTRNIFTIGPNEVIADVGDDNQAIASVVTGNYAVGELPYTSTL